MSGEPELQVGDSGEWVSHLQSQLTQVGLWSGGETGNFDDILDVAVRDFQARVGVVADGVVRQDTWYQIEVATTYGPVEEPPPQTEHVEPASPAQHDLAPMAIVLSTHSGDRTGHAIATDEPVQFSAMITNPNARSDTGELAVTWTLDGETVNQVAPSLAAGMSDWVLWEHGPIAAHGDHTVAVSWGPAGPYAGLGAGHLTFTVIPVIDPSMLHDPDGTHTSHNPGFGSNPSSPHPSSHQRSSDAPAGSHHEGFGHVSMRVVDWGELIYPAPKSIGVAEALDEWTVNTLGWFEQLYQAWHEAAPVDSSLNEVTTFLEHLPTTFESDIAAHAGGDQHTAEAMESQRELVAALDVEIESFKSDLEKTAGELDAAEEELRSVDEFKKAKDLRDAAAAEKKNVGFALEALDLAAKAWATLSDPKAAVAKIDELATKAFTSIAKIKNERATINDTNEVYAQAVHHAIEAAQKRIDSAHGYIDSMAPIAAKSATTAKDAIEFFVQLRQEAEAGFDRNGASSFRFSDLDAKVAQIEHLQPLIAKLRDLSENARGYGTSLVSAYRDAAVQLSSGENPDQQVLDALNTSVATANTMALQADTMLRDAVDSATRSETLTTKLTGIRERANYALSHRHSRAQ